ncbi:MAG: DegT/DnrJ/EryC1/StrS family aminotransferase [Desulfuromonadales bacterium]
MESIQFSKPTISLEKSDYTEIHKIINSGWVSIGVNVERLEAEFRSRYKVKHAIACSSCTQGLVVVMKAAGWRNKKVAVQPFTWPSTVYAIESNIGNVPVFCDIDPETWLIDINNLPVKAYDAVLAVDTFGNQAEIKTNKPVIYDSAHGFDLKDLGHRGIAEVISFSFTKVVSASEGGMILTNDNRLAETASELRRLSCRMPEINAVIALRSLKNYEKNQEAKIKIIDRYLKSFEFKFNTQRIQSCTNYSVFSILLDTPDERDAIAHALKKSGVEFKTYYDPLVSGLKNIDSVYSRILSLPVYPQIADVQDKICDIINAAAKSASIAQKIRHYSSSVPTPGKRYLKKSGYLDTYLRKQL